MADYIGQQLGKYRLTRLLGTGGFAEVYLGAHVHLGTEAAIKLLHTQLVTEAEVVKFRQEARTIGGLVHPNIVRVLDFDVQDDTPYLVMDYAPNGSLRQRLPPGRPLTPAEILPYLTQVADALQYAHEQRLVHRDIKPENMLLGRRGEVLLSDFGIATVAQSTTAQKTEGVAGTAAYMAPEQIQGKPRPSSDLYSLGVVVYEWLAGERPFQGTFTEVASQHLFAPPPPLREKLPGLSPLVEQVVMTALAKDAKERFGSVRAFAAAFGQACGVDPSVSMLATRAGVPGALPAGGQVSQQPGITVTDGSQVTPRVTPQVTPQVSVASLQGTPPGGAPGAGQLPQPGVSAAPGQAGNQLGPEVLFSPTQLIGPTGLTSLPQAGSGPYAPGAPQAGSGPYTGAAPQAGSGPYTGGASATDTGAGATLGNAPGSATYLPPGWAVAPAPVGSGPAHAAPPAPPGPPPGGKPRKGLRVALIAVAAVVALALIGGAAAYGLPLVLGGGSTGQHGTGPTAANSAMVTITPQSSDLKKTYTITGVTGSPDSSQQQVGARTVSATTQASSETVNATGQKTVAGMQATGTLLFYTNYMVQYPAGTVFTGSSGVSVAIDSGVNLDPYPNLPSSQTTVSAHAVNPGSNGNIAPGDINQGSNGVYSCPVQALKAELAPASGQQGTAPSVVRSPESPRSGSTTVICNPQAFTGGSDAATYTVVRQSDIDNAANTLIQANQPNAQQVVQGALKSNEQLVGTQQCQPNVNANPHAGNVANTVTVSVTFTCTGEAYDHDGALTLAAKLLVDAAASDPGGAYGLVGHVQTALVSATPDNQGGVAIVVNAEGIWEYQFTDAQKQALAQLIVGKSEQAAVTLLEGQTGVAQANIALPESMGQTLPTKASEITVKIQAVAGL